MGRKLLTYDRVKATGVSVSSTFNFNFDGATTPFGFTDITTVLEDLTYIPLAIVDLDTGDWEVGLYLYGSDTNEIFRGTGSTILANSLGTTAKINFTPGANKEVSVVNPAFFTTEREYNRGGDYITRIIHPETTLRVEQRNLFEIFTGFSDFIVATSIVDPKGLSYTQKHLSFVWTSGDESDSLAMLKTTLVRGAAAFVEYKVLALEETGVAGDGFGKVIAGEFLVVKSGNDQAFVGTPTQTTLFESASLSTASLDVSIDTQKVVFTVTGIAGMVIRWLLVADVIYSEASPD